MPVPNWKPFADVKLNVAEMINLYSVFDRVENIVGKWENAGLFHAICLKVIKIWNKLRQDR